MEGLMHICNYWGSKNCHPDVRIYSSAYERKPGEEIPALPSGMKFRKLNKICQNCDFRLFEIKEMKCPVCRNTDIKLSSIVNIEYQFGSIKGNLYKCDKCNTKLISDIIL